MAAVAEAAQSRQQHGRPGGPAPPPRVGPFPPARPRFEPVDREKTCPLLLRVFTKIGGHHAKEEFAIRGKEPKDEVQIYTWKDANLRELTDLVKEVASAARRRDAKLSFAFVYPDKQGRYVVRPVGMTYSYSGNGRRQDDMKTLAELGFQIGDYLDVAIL
uniref:Histone deacetylase complex subunit SAP18 n=1 Tax=Anthurium amnicola TaxID=1678845 RepID=A0A1D1Z832_9ARAE